MTILHVTPYFAPAWSFGGVCRAVRELAIAQHAAGHEVAVLTTDALTRSSRLAAGERLEDGLTVTRVRNASQWVRGHLNLSTPWGFRRAARRIVESHGIDVVHCHELRTVENLAVLGLDRRRGTPVMVLSPHGTTPYAIGRRRFKRGWDALFARWALPRFDRVIALTPAEAEDVQTLWRSCRVALAPDRVSVVPNGVDHEALGVLPPRATAAERWQLGAGPVVLFIGRLASRKGLRLLVEAFARAASSRPDARLLIAGPDEGEGDALRAAVARAGMSSQVVMPGMVSDEDRRLAFAAADVFALPAVGEGFSLAVLEAMAAGLPVVLSPHCQFPEVDSAGSGITVPLAAEAWAQALGALLDSPTRRAAMGQSARELVREKYRWPLVAAAIENVYDSARQTRTVP